jgi:hypothetical protein
VNLIEDDQAVFVLPEDQGGLCKLVAVFLRLEVEVLRVRALGELKR